MEEIWKPIKGYEGLYEVSNTGKVKSLNYRGTKKEKLLTPKENNSGRLMVGLQNRNKPKYYLIHRLVAQAFIPNPNEYPEINHIDENPKNNVVDNLEWCTRIYNVHCYQRNHPDYAKSRKYVTRRKRLQMNVLQMSLDGKVIRKWENSRTVFVETGMSDWSISECCRGKRKTAYGYIWQYASDNIGVRENS